jgi:hypothetical protein
MYYIHTILTEAEARQRAAAHATRLRPLLAPYLQARRRGVKHPVIDFLFEYYSFRPGRLLRWRPGLGIAVEGREARKWLADPDFVETSKGVTVDPGRFPAHRIPSLRWVVTLLEQTTARKPHLGCFGMHEWAMVYRTKQPRHAHVPLRMAPEALAAFVESQPITCTHFDAFRFFTEAARPLNRFQPTRDTIHELEQPGCLHANMDLYRWAYKFYPWVGSDLIADAFLLAYRIRTLDMQASPYDLRTYGLEPIPIETPEGRRRYRALQAQFYHEAQPLRHRLLQTLRTLLELAVTNT